MMKRQYWLLLSVIIVVVFFGFIQLQDSKSLRLQAKIIQEENNERYVQKESLEQGMLRHAIREFEQKRGVEFPTVPTPLCSTHSPVSGCFDAFEYVDLPCVPQGYKIHKQNGIVEISTSTENISDNNPCLLPKYGE